VGFRGPPNIFKKLLLINRLFGVPNPYLLEKTGARDE